ncbi:GNAT family N-acetyltransferase [Hamadaea sp. NPDC051192]|uniref:GNAT family N-acetyltransferase n=1 Tax=Hamadaea sp. NPDC051192 TaxID=3154940 RepID=UPI00342345B7
MSSRFVVRQATGSDVDTIIELREEAERWLAAKGVAQWTSDYSDYARSVLKQFVDDGSAWVVENHGIVVATFSLYAQPDEDFWAWSEDRHDALYLSKLIVRRSHASQGIADAALNWAATRTRDSGKRWLRIDVRRDNMALQSYYLARGFCHLRTWHAPERRTESGWLAQRAAGLVLPAPVSLAHVS